MTWQDRIVIDPTILVGKPIVKGTRLAVEFIVELLAQGWTEEQILSNHPELTREDVLACLGYASERLQSERVYPAVEGWFEREVTTMAEFLGAVRDAAMAWAPPKAEREAQSRITPWWRGQANSEWLLAPSLYRPRDEPGSDGDVREKPSPLAAEAAYLRDFMLHGRMLAEPQPKDDIEWYYLMRHHRLPSRVLDWSESPLVALFFALHYQPKPAKADAVVWGVRQGVINERWHRLGVLVGSDPRARLYLPDALPGAARRVRRRRASTARGRWAWEAALARAETMDFDRPVAVQPHSFAPRIIAQRSRFTIHGLNPDPLAKLRLKPTSTSRAAHRGPVAWSVGVAVL